MEATKENARTVATALTTAVNAVLLATVYAECERERVDKIERAVLQEQIYHGRHGLRDKPQGEGFRVLEPKDAWLMDEVSAAKYYARLNGIHERAGFADAAKGYCPALVAENLKIQAENVLIECAEKFFPGVTNSRLLCGTKNKNGLDTRREFIRLLIGLVVKSPGYVAPGLPKPKGA